MTHRRGSTIAAALVFISTAAFTPADDKEHGQGAFEFALIGDVPYDGAPGQPYPPFDRVIAEVNRDHRLRWVLHAGDIKNGSTLCSDEMFLDRLTRYNRFRVPVILTPGDNEWTDCHRVNNGPYAPLERLARLRQVFFPEPGQTLGGGNMTVDSQASRPGFEEFPENVRWSARHVQFATMHIVGSRNGLAPFDPASSVKRTPADDAEVQRRTQAALAWMDETFAQARAQRSAGVFLMIHGNPGLEFPAGADRRGFESFLAALEAHVVAYGKPVVLAHGDSHYFRIDMPRLVTQPFLKNFTRVETFGALNVHWVRVIVDPRLPEVFRFQAEIIAGN
jgi:hypothetical protein